MRHPTLRKLRNRNLEPIRYHDRDEVRHGYIVERLPRGGLVIRLVGEDRNRRVSIKEARYVTTLGTEG